MAIIVRCTECGTLERNAVLTDVLRAVAVGHERWHTEQGEPPSQYALCCPDCSWFYEPRTEVLVRNESLRELILSQHQKVCVGAGVSALHAVEGTGGRPGADRAAASGGSAVPAPARNSPQRRAG